MDEITPVIFADHLRQLGATCEQVDHFAHLYPEGLAITTPNALKALKAGLDVLWVAQTLPPPAWAEYYRATAHARAKYTLVIASARADHERANASAIAEYNRASICWSTFDHAIASAWTKYGRAIASAQAEYDRSRIDQLIPLLCAHWITILEERSAA